MLVWITSHLGDLLVGAIILTIIILVIRSMLKRKKLGPCAGCSFAAGSSKCRTGQISCGIDYPNCNFKDLSLEELQEILDQQDWPDSKAE
ncbi:MAG: FeoB-associated Cys-rich membrane protein [Saccharofermentanales bacterium]|jgi:hypothetical protein